MTRIFLLLIICIGLGTKLSAQKQDESPGLPWLKTTYPIDSCIYLMDPLDLRVTGQRMLGEDIREYQVLFRSSSDNTLDYLVRGTGSWLRDSLFFDGIGPIRNGDELRIVASLPETVENPDGGWSGGDLPFPSFLNGFIMRIGDQVVEPPVSIGLHVIRHEVIPLDD